MHEGDPKEKGCNVDMSDSSFDFGEEDVDSSNPITIHLRIIRVLCIFMH